MRKYVFAILMLVVAVLVFADSNYPKNSTISFARLEYDCALKEENNIKCWWTDYPDMDDHVVDLLSRITTMKDINPVVVRLDPKRTDYDGEWLAERDERLKTNIFDYPLVYIVEPEQVNLSNKEENIMREYLARGGHLFLDDFHGDQDLEPVLKWVGEVTHKQPFEMQLTHDLFHVHYDITNIIQVVNDGIFKCAFVETPPSCVPWENGPSGKDSKILGWLDDNGELQIVAAFNEDLGDGLEWAYEPWYDQKMTTFATKFITNVFVYFASH